MSSLINDLIPFVLGTIAALVVTLMIFVYAMGFEGRDGVIGRIIDGNTIQLQMNVQVVTDSMVDAVPHTTGLTSVHSVN